MTIPIQLFYPILVKNAIDLILSGLVLDAWSVQSLGDHQMIDDLEENVDDVQHIKLDTIIPNKNYI